MWYPVKTRTIAQNLSDKRETLYLFYYKLAALHMFEFGARPHIGDGVGLRDQIWCHSKVSYWFPIGSP